MTPLRAALPALLLALAACLAPAHAVRAQETKAAHHEARVRLDPATGDMRLENTITLTAQDGLDLHLDDVFAIESLSIDGVHRAPEHKDGLLRIDVGSLGTHRVDIVTHANLATRSGRQEPPFLGQEGGFLGLGWLANPQGWPATYRIEVQSRLPAVAVLPGRLSAETRDEQTYSATFASDVPDDTPVLITGPFEVAETLAGNVRLRTYFHAELAALAPGYLADAQRYIEHYAATIGPYPHPGFAMVSGPLPIGIGLPGMTYMGRNVLALPFIRFTSLPHEVLHNWWGNGVFIDYAHGNWAEGLTTYQADHAQAAAQDKDGGRDKRLEWLRNYAALPAERDQPLSAFTAKNHDASQVVGYDKVAFVFHMLKIRLGAETFDAAIRRFYADNLQRFAGWPQVQAAFEAASGEKLDAFFDAWIKRPGAPRLTLTSVRTEGHTLSFTLTQTQDGEAYPLSVPVDVETDSGTHRLFAVMDGKSQAFRFDAGGKPRALSVDPDFDVFRRLDGAETPPILRDVTLNPDTRLISPKAGGETKDAARALAESLIQGPVTEISGQTLPSGPPLIVAGLEDDVAAYLARQGLPPLPAELAAPAQAKAYVVRLKDGRAVLVALARDADGLRALTRALTHYKRRSFVVMNEDGVTDKGTWPAPQGPLNRRLE